MDQERRETRAGRHAAITTAVSVIAGIGSGWLTYRLSGNIPASIGVTGPVALLSNALLSKKSREPKG